MNNEVKLKIIKTIHSLVWLVMALASFFILYSGIIGSTSKLLWFSIGLLLFETFVLFINKWTCPLTPMAKKYTSDRGDNFDIYLPLIIAKYNKIIFGSIFVIGLFLVIVNVFVK